MVIATYLMVIPEVPARAILGHDNLLIRWYIAISLNDVVIFKQISK